jgi:hypothetical protein
VQATVYRYDEGTQSGSVLLDDGLELAFDAEAVRAGGMQFLRFGQRVRIRITGSGADQKVTSLILSTLADPA